MFWKYAEVIWVAKKYEKVLKSGEKSVRNLPGLPQLIKSDMQSAYTACGISQYSLKDFEANYFWEEAGRVWLSKCGKGMEERGFFLLFFATQWVVIQWKETFIGAEPWKSERQQGRISAKNISIRC